MIISGVDFSISSCGIANYNTETKKWKVFCISEPKHSGRITAEYAYRRLKYIGENLCLFLKDSDAIMLEGWAGLGNENVPTRAESLGYGLGLLDEKVRYINTIQPNSWRRIITGYGVATKNARVFYGIDLMLDQQKANKEIVKRAIKRKLGFCFGKSDENDAVGLCCIGCAFWNVLDSFVLSDKDRSLISKKYITGVK